MVTLFFKLVFHTHAQTDTDTQTYVNPLCIERVNSSPQDKESKTKKKLQPSLLLRLSYKDNKYIKSAHYYAYDNVLLNTQKTFNAFIVIKKKNLLH